MAEPVDMLPVPEPHAGDRVLDDVTLPSNARSDRAVLARLEQVLDRGTMTEDQLQRLKTAVAEAVINAVEHGNQHRATSPIRVRVLEGRDHVAVTVTDSGAGPRIPIGGDDPDIDAKLAGLEAPRGWGLFLIRNMVDAVEQSDLPGSSTVTLTMLLGESSSRDTGAEADDRLV